MTRYFRKLATGLIENVGSRLERQLASSGSFADAVAYRVALELMVKDTGEKPNKLFSGISDDYWFWLNTAGYRKNQILRRILPGVPDENVQLSFTGNKGDAVLREGFSAYRLFKELYETHVGPIAQCNRVLDFGCGWGRIIRFFIKDVDPSRVYGCDPVDEMINICKAQNKWCNFERINTTPPTPFHDDSFELIYGFSVFSHLSEEMHNSCLAELRRILKPGGLLIMTTRSRAFIELCAELRKRSDLDSIHPGPRSSASAFIDTMQCLSDYDHGNYCFTQLAHEWSYWGEAAIPKSYVLGEWTKYLSFVDYIDDHTKCDQNVIVMTKPITR